MEKITGNGGSSARPADINSLSGILRTSGLTQTAVKGDSTGCNWAAYGFFGTLGKGRLIIMEDGEEVEVFAFAGKEGEENGRKDVQETE